MIKTAAHSALRFIQRIIVSLLSINNRGAQYCVAGARLFDAHTREEWNCFIPISEPKIKFFFFPPRNRTGFVCYNYFYTTRRTLRAQLFFPTNGLSSRVHYCRLIFRSRNWNSQCYVADARLFDAHTREKQHRFIPILEAKMKFFFFFPNRNWTGFVYYGYFYTTNTAPAIFFPSTVFPPVFIIAV